MQQTLPMTGQEEETLRLLEQCLHDLYEVSKLDLYPAVVLEERCTKAQLLDALKYCRYQGQRVNTSWTKRSLVEAYQHIFIRQRKHELIKQRDTFAQWFYDQGLGELVAEKLAQAEETRLRVVIGPPDPE